MRVGWRDGGGRTHLLGSTSLGPMLGNDPNMALSVLYALGRWEACRSVGGGGEHGPVAQGLGEGGRGGRGEQQEQAEQQQHPQHQRGEDGPRQNPHTQTPPRTPRNLESPATSRVARKTPPLSPQPPSPSPRPCPSPSPRVRPSSPPKPQPPPPPWRKGVTTLWESAKCGGHPVCPSGTGGQWGDRHPSDGVGRLG